MQYIHTTHPTVDSLQNPSHLAYQISNPSCYAPTLLQFHVLHRDRFVALGPFFSVLLLLLSPIFSAARNSSWEAGQIVEAAGRMAVYSKACRKNNMFFL